MAALMLYSDKSALNVPAVLLSYPKSLNADSAHFAGLSAAPKKFKPRGMLVAVNPGVNKSMSAS